MPRDCHAKIVATIGPANSDAATIAALLEAGADVFRLNFSHGTHEDHRTRYEIIRDLEKLLGRPIGVLADLQGPKLRVGQIPGGPRDLAPGDRVRLVPRANGDMVPLPHPEVFAALSPGVALLIDDGKLRLVIEEASVDAALARVEVGGRLLNRKGVGVVGAVLPVSALTDKDRVDLAFALELGADWIALSFVQRPENIDEVRTLVGGRSGSNLPPGTRRGESGSGRDDRRYHMPCAPAVGVPPAGEGARHLHALWHNQHPYCPGTSRRSDLRSDAGCRGRPPACVALGHLSDRDRARGPGDQESSTWLAPSPRTAAPLRAATSLPSRRVCPSAFPAQPTSFASREYPRRSRNHDPSHRHQLRVDIRDCALGDGIAVDIPPLAGTVAAAFNATEVARLVRWAQANADDYSYVAFSEKVKAAGCAGYLVSFLGRRVVYFGRAAETHVEHFPNGRNPGEDASGLLIDGGIPAS